MQELSSDEEFIAFFEEAPQNKKAIQQATIDVLMQGTKQKILKLNPEDLTREVALSKQKKEQRLVELNVVHIASAVAAEEEISPSNPSRCAASC